MKKSGFFITLAACFVGVLGALQVDKWMSQRKTDDVFAESTPAWGKIRPANAEPLTAPSFDFREAAKRAMPSVVSVDRFDQVRGFMEAQASERETGSGSGVIVSNDGIIVTNNHVIEPRMTRTGKEIVPRIQVRLYDGRKVNAKLLGRDPRSDIAVLKVEAGNLKPIELGTSGNLEIGEWVMAVGNPLGFENTVSVGVVSSTKRDLPVGEQGLVEGIQTDAAINPGNSGGALCNAQGQLVGINTAIASGTGQSVGIGFAIPIDRARKIVNDIVKYGVAKYPGLGITYQAAAVGRMDDPYIRPDIAEFLGREDFPNHGLIIREVTGPSATAGIKPKDILVEIDGRKIETSFDLNKSIVTKKIGDVVNIKFWQDGKLKDAKVTLMELKPSI